MRFLMETLRCFKFATFITRSAQPHSVITKNPEFKVSKMIFISFPLCNEWCRAESCAIILEKVNRKHKSIGNISQLETRPLIGWLARSTNQRPGSRPGFQLTYASKTLAHDPAPKESCSLWHLTVWQISILTTYSIYILPWAAYLF